jgi:CheY-like chemotaxis protein
MSDKRILIVEDNADNLVLMTDVLQTLKYRLFTARDGEQGVQLAISEKPDLILMDLQLPLVDGWTATRRIKAIPELRHIPIIAVSAHAMPGDKERALEAGCDDYIPKPIKIAELRAKMLQYLTTVSDE